jgi:hypothetical protein
MSYQDHGDKKPSRIQSVTITLSSILYSAIHGIVGYIAVYFFKPLWEKIINWRNK